MASYISLLFGSLSWVDLFCADSSVSCQDIYCMLCHTVIIYFKGYQVLPISKEEDVAKEGGVESSGSQHAQSSRM